MGDTHWWVRQATNAVVLQLFREGIVTTMVHSTTLAATVTGGVLRRTIYKRLVPLPVLLQYGNVYRDNGSKTFGFSVRCLRD
jgi:hypothetical protein